MDAPLDKHLALVGFMGAGKSSLGREAAARLGRPFVDLDREIEARAGLGVPEIFRERGEAGFRDLEEAVWHDVVSDARPTVFALGGGAVTSAAVREALASRAITVLVEIEVDVAWQRAAGGDRPLARDEGDFRRLYEERRPLYAAVADAVARDADDVVLAAGGIHVGIGSLELLQDLIPGRGPVALVSDSRVAGIHGPSAQVVLGERLASMHELPPGEDAKTLASCERLWRELRLDRGGTVVALGGGCTTDCAGFAAATYMRGVAWAAVPSSLVGQVDAGIGAKTGINLPEAKNLVGAFHWPTRTIVDPALLATLPARERRAGMAEVVKTGLLAGRPLWELPDAELVRRCAAYKTEVCLRDPYERGERAVLNLGHTFAHALEAASDYAVPHGEAVALGLTAALKLSGLDDQAEMVRSVLAPKPVRADRQRAWEAMRRDKKSRDGRVTLVLLEAPGRPRVTPDVPEADTRGALDELIAD